MTSPLANSSKSILINIFFHAHHFDNFWEDIFQLPRTQYHVKVAETKEKITELLKAGFEWVGQDNDGLTCFRKRK